MYSFTFTENGIGQIQIDDFKESFISDLSYWSQDEYEKHWATATEHLRAGNPVCFLTSFTDPAKANFFRAWSCYPEKNELIFQEQILFLEQLESEFIITHPHKKPLPYSSSTEEGEQISEWRTSF